MHWANYTQHKMHKKYQPDPKSTSGGSGATYLLTWYLVAAGRRMSYLLGRSVGSSSSSLS
ncbi:uncharacterized protein BDW47DRAFT_109633 [Aspergillus candidus]|uniref:Uncharacterized protein n=1 Tax=Aspergillus candidus TaxID=41067 RepID=A0A2I2F5D7_ASPCN|nr:hypothetical protein BDW47DRAFT_109633 [Aspergillus candidus]PLB35862.1 hypothetical protein BDW47DRAFT_109633 [Aspergillus candidus]